MIEALTANPYTTSAFTRREANSTFENCRRRLRLSSIVPLFEGVDDELIVDALVGCTVLEIERQTRLLTPGAANDKMFILLSGEMTIDIGTREAPHAIKCHPGQSVGEMSIADKSPASALVTAHPGSRVLMVEEDVFWLRLMTLPAVARNLFSIHAERLRRNNEQLVEKLRKEMQYEQIKRDLAVAAEIQVGMLPQSFPLYPNLPQFDVYARMTPARDIGGDFYDAFMIDNDKLFFIIGDVSGKGVGAALFMVRAMTLFRTEASRNEAPHVTLRSVNNQLARNNDNCMFVTVICGVLNIRTGQVAYSNGGHNPPLVGNAAGFRFAPIPEGPLVGAMEDGDFATATMRLWPGEMLLLYTDGVTEAINPVCEQFSAARLIGTLSATGAANAAVTVDSIIAAVEAFSAGEPPFDDVTVLAIKYRSERTVAVRWDPEWSVGIYDIDHQHHRLLAIINRMEDLISDHGAIDALRDLGDALLEECSEHFVTEEAYISASGRSPESHAQAHRALATTIKGLIEDIRPEASPSAIKKAVSTLATVWIHHITVVDSTLPKHHQ